MQQTIDAWTRRRFAVAAGSLTTIFGFGGITPVGAKRRKNKKIRKQNHCLVDGTRCGKQSKLCQARFCLHAPFTIEATWRNDGRQQAYLVVPPENAATGPGPYLNFACNSTSSPNCGTRYPFACIDEDQVGPGDGVTTVRQLLPGAYEYWIQLSTETDAGDLTIVLRDKSGRVVREWSSPASPSIDDEHSWHVFDIDGKRGSVIAVDDVVAQTLPKAAVDPFTFVCGI